MNPDRGPRFGLPGNPLGAAGVARGCVARRGICIGGRGSDMKSRISAALLYIDSE